MKLLLALFDRVLLVASVLFGGCLHSFILNYRQRIEGHLNQSQADLQQFQQIADRHFNGSLPDLIQSYSVDTTSAIQETANAVKNIWDTSEELRLVFEGLQGNVIQQIQTMLEYYDKEKLVATWEIYQPSFTLSLDSMLMALLSAVTIWGTFMLLKSIVLTTIEAIQSKTTRRRHIKKNMN